MEGVLKPQSPGGLVSRSRIASSPPFFLGDILVQCKNEGRKGSGYATTGVALIFVIPSITDPFMRFLVFRCLSSP